VTASDVVVIGGGVVGCSIAYHLAVSGCTDVTVLERTSLTHGSTWHAAGLVGQLRSSAALTELMRRSVQVYRGLGHATGYPIGWHEVGSIRVAASADRWQELRRIATTGRSFGFDVHLLSPADAVELFPLLDATGLHGATWVPSDGYVDPSQLTQSFAAGARKLGVRFVQHCRVEGIERAGRRVTAVRTGDGLVECGALVNATGMWGAETARMGGVAVAVGVVEHQYVVTERSAAVPADLPTLRDPDARFYLKPDNGALALGGWEEGTRVPWTTIPRDLGAELLPPDHDRFAPIAAGAALRVPVVGELGIRAWYNGPIPFTPDAEPLMGLTGELDNLYHCCGFSAGVAAAGGAGQAMAAWILDGDPGLDLWPFDVRRFGPAHTIPGYLEQRVVAAYEHYYAVSYPNRELSAPRGQRRSALFDVLASRGAVNGSKFGWERANWFAPVGVAAVETPTFLRSEAWPHVAAEHAAVREAVGVVDLSSFAKLHVSGPDAVAFLQTVAGADLDVAVGRVVYTQLLDERGGIQADITVTRLAEDLFYLVTGTASGRHDTAFLQGHVADATVTLTDVTSAFGVLGVWGPRARQVLQRISRTDLADTAFGFLTAQQIDVGHSPAVALRVSFVGELGWELHVPTEHLRDLYDRLLDAGSGAGLRDVGYRAVDSLRLEKHMPVWGTDIRADDDPYQAGLGFAVRPDKPRLLAGPALRRIKDAGPTRRLRWFSTAVDDVVTGALVLHGGELLAHPASGTVTTVRSGGYGHTVGRGIVSAYLPAGLADTTGFLVDVDGQQVALRLDELPLHDPGGTRVRG
jgi:sarcosine dehydrogenase